MIGQTLRLKVAALTDIAPSLRHVRLVAADGGKLPPAAAGAHIQLVLAGPGRSFRNAYSLVSRPGARDAWDIIVRRVPASRGGSAYIHEALQAGDTLEASWPGNLFAPVRTARRDLLVAGGIGITPFLSYLADFAMSGGEHALHVCCREEEKDVFAPWLAGRSGVAFHWDADGHRLDIPALLAAQPAGTHLYVCGPAAMNDEVIAAAAAAGWPASHVHCEHFGARWWAAKPSGPSWRSQASRCRWARTRACSTPSSGPASPPPACAAAASAACAWPRCWKARPSTATTSCPPPSAKAAA